MQNSIDSRLRRAYAMWGENRVEFKRDDLRTLITFVWNVERSLQEKSVICRCVGGHLMIPAPSFACKASETCYELCRGESVDDIVAELSKAAALEFYINDKDTKVLGSL